MSNHITCLFPITYDTANVLKNAFSVRSVKEILQQIYSHEASTLSFGESQSIGNMFFAVFIPSKEKRCFQYRLLKVRVVTPLSTIDSATISPHFRSLSVSFWFSIFSAICIIMNILPPSRYNQKSMALYLSVTSAPFLKESKSAFFLSAENG